MNDSEERRGLVWCVFVLIVPSLMHFRPRSRFPNPPTRPPPRSRLGDHRTAKEDTHCTRHDQHSDARQGADSRGANNACRSNRDELQRVVQAAPAVLQREGLTSIDPPASGTHLRPVPRTSFPAASAFPPPWPRLHYRTVEYLLSTRFLHTQTCSQSQSGSLRPLEGL